MSVKIYSNDIKYLTASLLITLTAAYIILLYFVPRSNFPVTYALFLFLFIIYYYLVKKTDLFSLRNCLILAVVLRLIALFSLPVLTDDYFRFIWDGKLFLNHVNPFSYTPKQYLASHSDLQLHYLYNHLIFESQDAFTGG